MTIVEERLRIVPEFRPEEYAQVTQVVSGKLDRRLSRWNPEQVELELSVKDRDTAKQRTVLECWIAGLPKMVATSRETDLNRAVTEVRDDLFKQIDKFLTKRESSRRR